MAFLASGLHDNNSPGQVAVTETTYHRWRMRTNSHLQQCTVRR